MTLTKRMLTPGVAMRSRGDFDAMWREMEKTFQDIWPVAHGKVTHLYSGWEPRVDLVEHDDAYHVQADLPGMQLDDIDVEFQDGTLTIRGERRFQEDTQAGYHRKERAYGAFARRFALSAPVEAEAITASYTNGVLEVHVPKAAEAQPKRIPIDIK